MDLSLFKQLLAEGESSRLDYKSRQYPFVGATDDQKSELLKDVLSMANAWREADAYVLVGVQEEKGKLARTVGIVDHLDDAAIQQFVNQKTNRPIQFAYSEFQAEGHVVAAIRIPVQRRPFFLLKPYGPLGANIVYVRRGSSTDIADPDEVFRMGEAAVPAQQAPELEVEFAQLSDRKPLGQQVEIRGLVLEPLTDDELPEVRERSNPYGISVDFALGTLNHQYYRELRDFIWARGAVRAFGFVARNKSRVVAHGVRAALRVPYTDDLLLIENYPRRPVVRYDLSRLIRPATAMDAFNPDIWFDRHGDEWHVNVDFGKVQPGSDAWTSSRLHIGTRTPGTALLHGNCSATTSTRCRSSSRLSQIPNVAR